MRKPSDFCLDIVAALQREACAQGEPRVGDYFWFTSKVWMWYAAFFRCFNC